MSYVPNPPNVEVNTDASGRTRTSQMSTLFDGKSLNADEVLLWDNVGTGTFTFLNNIMNMSVTAGQYLIRRGKHYLPYFSGKSQIIETTFDGFSAQSGVTKRVGYFSSSPIAPYDTGLDGFFLENDTVNGVRIRIFNNGSELTSINIADWDNYGQISSYNWGNFTVAMWDFLWLGGTELRLIIKTDEGFVLAHTYKHAGTRTGLFIKSPNQSVRYEIRSSTGAGDLNSVCSQVATEGGFPEAGKPLVIYSPTKVDTNEVDTIYAIKGVKKLASFRDIGVTVTRASFTNNTVNDFGIGLILLNPTLSAPLSYVNNGVIEDGTATTQTVTDVGRILASFPSGAAGSISGANDSILSSIPMDIDDVSGEIVLAYMPTTANQAMYGTLTLKEY